uniref:DUF3416 n=1 Tax=uncultured Sphaerobacter sp. TaxID=211440 RepID=A0A060C2A9_9BACT|nr:DUF3416 [uncultured Sphaerobacter sp.]
MPFTDGHDVISCLLEYRWAGNNDWQQLRMQPLGNDRWRAEFRVVKLGRYQYRLSAWVDHF